jgi:hypothetical protein
LVSSIAFCFTLTSFLSNSANSFFSSIAFCNSLSCACCKLFWMLTLLLAKFWTLKFSALSALSSSCNRCISWGANNPCWDNLFCISCILTLLFAVIWAALLASCRSLEILAISSDILNDLSRICLLSSSILFSLVITSLLFKAPF